MLLAEDIDLESYAMVRATPKVASKINGGGIIFIGRCRSQSSLHGVNVSAKDLLLLDPLRVGSLAWRAFWIILRTYTVRT